MVAESEKAARNGPQSRFSNAVRNRWSATATAAESWTARSAAAPPIGVIDWPRSAGGDARVARNTESIVRRNGALELSGRNRVGRRHPPGAQPEHRRGRTRDGRGLRAISPQWSEPQYHAPTRHPCHRRRERPTVPLAGDRRAAPPPRLRRGRRALRGQIGAPRPRTERGDSQASRKTAECSDGAG